MKWRYFEREEWVRKPLPNTFPCKYCSDWSRVRVRYVFDGWDEIPPGTPLEAFEKMGVLFKMWLESPSKTLNGMVVCSKCGYNLSPLQVSYTEEEKEALRTHLLPREPRVDFAIFPPGQPEEPHITMDVVLPRAFKRVSGKLKPVFK